MSLIQMNVVEVAAKCASSIDTINNLRNMKMILQNGKKNMGITEEDKLKKEKKNNITEG